MLCWSPKVLWAWTQGQGRLLPESCSVCLFRLTHDTILHPPTPGCSSLGLLQLALPAVMNKGMDANPPLSQPILPAAPSHFLVVAHCWSSLVCQSLLSLHAEGLRIWSPSAGWGHLPVQGPTVLLPCRLIALWSPPAHLDINWFPGSCLPVNW